MTAPANILIVDDTPINLHLLGRLLKKHGYEVLPASCGRDALAAAQKGGIDIVLLDIMMPEMDGYEVCRRLKADEATNDIPILFLSSLSAILDKVKAFEAGGVDYITKPFQAEEVLARVGIHLNLRRLQQELKDRNRELARLVNIDGLTQIANRRYFDTYMEQEWKRLSREKKFISLIFIDIDYFKLYNDCYGHQAGDECLKQLARLFDEAAKRPADLSARYGGEEFVVLLPSTDKEGAEHIAEGIRESLRKLQIPHERSSVNPLVTCSMGIVCMIPIPDFSMKAFIDAADDALYQAKAHGRDQFVIKELRTMKNLPVDQL